MLIDGFQTNSLLSRVRRRPCTLASPEKLERLETLAVGFR
jgi:hypothetical protein